jgi:hypothetical protein
VSSQQIVAAVESALTELGLWSEDEELADK